MNFPVIFLKKVTKLHPRIIGNNLVTIYVFPEVSCVFPNKASYMDYETLEKVMKVVAPGIRKMKVINVACIFTILFSIYLTLRICPSKFSSDDL